MRILWFTWKDTKNPLAGGAEIVNEELRKRLIANNHEVILITAGFRNARDEETIDGSKIIRVGGRLSVYWQAYKYYKKHLVGWADLVIDEMNTIPFFCKYYVKEKNIMFVHQLCRKIWFYQLPWFIAWIGYLAESVYLRLLNNCRAITVSKSSKNDLIHFGFKDDNINIISEGIQIKPIESIEDVRKCTALTMLALGSIRPMKRTNHIIKAFIIAKEKLPGLQFIIAGDADCRYGKKVLKSLHSCKYSDSIQYLGKVTPEKKTELMQKAHILCVTSVKEGWGLVVTEANSQGTPAIVYNVDGLRDSVDDGNTGIICKKNIPTELAKNIVVLLQNQSTYMKLQIGGLFLAKNINFSNSYSQFVEIIEDYVK